MLVRALTAITLALASACTQDPGGGTTVVDGGDLGPPRWRFETVSHGLGEATLTSVWSRSDNVVFAVGWYGAIYTNRPGPGNRDGDWERMDSPTAVHLTAITGVENGARFGLPAADGEMFAVGWSGTLLHYHPNPDGDASSDDGEWTVVAGPEATSFRPLLRVDTSCPDYDGDGVGDDGTGDGFWGDVVCGEPGAVAGSCDDNCREAANGPDRPIADLNTDGSVCIGEDGPDPTEPIQVDADGDGIGFACDEDDVVPGAGGQFVYMLFDVTAHWDGGTNTLTVAAVGEGGAVVSYVGASAVDPVVPPATLPVTDAGAWYAIAGLQYRFDNDCAANTPPGQPCPGSGRPPPSCPAVCNPLRDNTNGATPGCPCPVGGGQCCDPATSTGSACTAPLTCGAVLNACDDTTGICRIDCPGCFRRMAKTLRGVAIDGTTIVAVGADATLVVGDIGSLHAEWTQPSCAATGLPKPFDDEPLLTRVDAAGGTVIFVGANGAMGRFDPGGTCEYAPIAGAPPGFLSGVHAFAFDTFYVVGDEGTLLELTDAAAAIPCAAGATCQGGICTCPLDTEVDATLVDMVRTVDAEGRNEMWIVGATGILVHGLYY